jgi:hypothetical protein
VVTAIAAELPPPAAANPPAKTGPPKAKSKFNTQIYEKDDPVESFSDEVMLVREMAGEGQVKFKSHPGFYRLPEGDQQMQSRLVTAQKNHKAVSVKAHSDTKVIQGVTLDGM